MEVRFYSVRELFTDMHQFTKRTNTDVLSADAPHHSPPLMGWVAVTISESGDVIDPPEERYWTISIGDFKKTCSDFIPSHVIAELSKYANMQFGRARVTELILKMFCYKCSTFVARTEHTKEECIMAEVMNT